MGKAAADGKPGAMFLEYLKVACGFVLGSGEGGKKMGRDDSHVGHDADHTFWGCCGRSGPERFGEQAFEPRQGQSNSCGPQKSAARDNRLGNRGGWWGAQRHTLESRSELGVSGMADLDGDIVYECSVEGLAAAAMDGKVVADDEMD
jgi:hypothetical protein